MESELDEIADSIAFIAMDMAKIKSDYRKVKEKLAKIDGLKRNIALLKSACDHKDYNDLLPFSGKYFDDKVPVKVFLFRSPR